MEVTGLQGPSKEQPRSNEDHGQQNEKSNDSRTEADFVPWRIFINQMDSYHGKKLADSLPGREYIANTSGERDTREGIDLSDEMENEENGNRGSRRNEISRAGGNEDDDSGEEVNLDEEGTDFTETKDKTTRRKLEVIGTVKDQEYKRPEDVSMVVRTTKNRELLLRELMKCGVVIYDITQDDSQIEEASWALEAIVRELSTFRRDAPKAFQRNAERRYFILISTLMTWSMTKPLDPENPDLPFTEADYRKRKSHPNFRAHIKCEREVATIVKRNDLGDKLKTVVIGSGITYGDEEGPLHYLFKMAWKSADYLPIYGIGTNKIPLLYVRDLVEIVYMLMGKWPKSRYIVAAEQELISQATIVKKISKALATGKIEHVTPEEAFLSNELSQRSYDVINADINIAPGYIIDNELHWYRETPFRDNVAAIVEEYKKSRNLYPVKIIVLGPPASGKTLLAQRLAEHYDIHYIHVKSLIEETIQKLSKDIEAADVGKQDTGRVNFEEVEDDDEDDDDMNKGDVSGVDNPQEQLNEIRDNLTANNGRLGDDILNKIFLKRLLSNDCQNQGYVIDGYPKTLMQAKNLFDTDDNDEEDIDETENDFSDISMIGGNRKILPELVIVLDANDEFLIERVIRLPEKDVQRTHYNEEGMLRRLREYREKNTDEETPLQFFDEKEIHPLVITIEDDICPEMFSTFVRCIERLGEPRNYGPSDAEREEMKKRIETEALEKLAIEAARKERENLEMKMARERKMMEWTDLLEKLKQEEEEQLCVMVEPLRHYLVKYIFPTLTKGLVEVAKLRPDDPIDFLAEYLFRENPEGKMFEPDYTETMSTLLDAIEKLQEKLLPMSDLDIGDEKYLKSDGEKARIGVTCRISSNDEAMILTEEDDDDDDNDVRTREIMKCYEMETELDLNDMKSHTMESDIMIASSFSYEQIAEDSRNSFEISSNLSLEDSR